MAMDSAPDKPTGASGPSAADGENRLRFRLEPDRQSVVLDLAGGGESDPPMTWDEVLAGWKPLGLPETLLQGEALMAVIDAWNADRHAVQGLPAARSPHPPRHGKQAVLEILVPLIRPGAVEAREGAADTGAAEATEATEAAVDHKAGRAMVEVEPGQPLMRKHPATPGVAGEDLFGEPVAARDGQDAALPLGEGTELSTEDPNLAVAKVGGFVRFDKGLLCVRECFVVSGSVDYSVGNVRYAKSVAVQGDVQDGFSVESGGDVAVGGTVGDAQVKALGSVTIGRGLSGTGKGKVEAQGDVEVGFLSNQKLRAYGDIRVAKEAFNANLGTRQSLHVAGPLVGGTVMASLSVHCRALGNELGTRTEVELGIDFLEAERRAGLDKKIKELKGAALAIQGYKAKTKEEYLRTKALDAATIRKLTDLRGKLEKIQTALPLLEKRREEVVERIRAGFARDGIELIVEGRVYPGAVIKAGDSTLRISEELPGPRKFVFKDCRLHAY